MSEYGRGGTRQYEDDRWRQHRGYRDWRQSRDWQQYFGGPPRDIDEGEGGQAQGRRAYGRSEDWGEGQGGPGPGGFSQGSQRGWNSSGYPDRRGSDWSGPYVGRGPKNYQRSDQRIYEDVCDHLTQDDHIDASDLEVKVTNGVVTFTGTVPSRQAKRRAEDIAESVWGVADVDNQLRVSHERSSRPGEDGVATGTP